MRRILIDRARKRNRTRHGLGFARIDLQPIEIAETATDRQRYVVGMRIPDSAGALGISEFTAKRPPNYVRLWLCKELKGMTG